MEAALIAIAVAALGLLGVLSGHILGRLNKLENDLAAARDDLTEAQDYNRRLWLYTRALIDLYYRHRPAGAPDPSPLPEE